MAAVDRRRNNPPALSSKPVFEDDDVHMFDALDRARASNEPRKIFLRTGLIKEANGSSYLERENIKIICAVHGPRQQARSTPFSPNAKVACEVKYAPFACAERHGYVRDTHERDLSNELANAIRPSILTHLFPKSEIAIYVTILEEDGPSATLAAALTAASVAVADAGIECHDLVTSSSLLMRDGQIIVDAAGREMQDGDADFVIGYMSNRDEIVMLRKTGSVVDLTQMDQLLQSGIEQANLLRAIVSKSLQNQ